jgi:hypothetical protein
VQRRSSGTSFDDVMHNSQGYGTYRDIGVETVLEDVSIEQFIKLQADSPMKHLSSELSSEILFRLNKAKRTITMPLSIHGSLNSLLTVC